MTVRWRFNPKNFLQVCTILMDVDDNEPEYLYRSVINRCYLVALQVAAYHLQSKGRHLPQNSDYYKEVREKLIEIGVDENLTDDLNDLQDMRVQSDYRYSVTINSNKVRHFMTITDHIIFELDNYFPESCL